MFGSLLWRPVPRPPWRGGGGDAWVSARVGCPWGRAGLPGTGGLWGGLGLLDALAHFPGPYRPPRAAGSHLPSAAGAAARGFGDTP